MIKDTPGVSMAKWICTTFLAAGFALCTSCKIKHVAEVRLNGKNLGVLWCAPWRVEITGAIKTTDNLLEIDVINLWANRVIGDLNRPKEKRFTTTHDGFRFDMLRGSTPLLDAGLMGPVRI